MIIYVRVKPGSKQGDKLERIGEGEFVAYLKARAHDGEANKALVELLSREFKVAKTTVVIKRGAATREKLVEIIEQKT